MKIADQKRINEQLTAKILDHEYDLSNLKQQLLECQQEPLDLRQQLKLLEESQQATDIARDQARKAEELAAKSRFPPSATSASTQTEHAQAANSVEVMAVYNNQLFEVGS